MDGEPSADRPFRIPADQPGRARRGLVRLLRPALELAFRFPTLNELYRATVALADDGRPFLARAVTAMDVAIEVSDEELSAIPPDGPLLVVANHPFGGLEALALSELLHRAGRELRFVANFLLGMIPDIGREMFPVDPFGGASATARSLAGLKAAIRWVRDGGALAVFPAGEVAHARWRNLRPSDPPWSNLLGRLAARTGAPVLGVFFEGGNSLLFQALGLVHPKLRTLMLPRELVRRRHGRIRARIGRPIPASKLAEFEDPAELTGYLRVRTHLLGCGGVQPAGQPAEPADQPSAPASAAADSAVAREVAALPRGNKLLDSGGFAVYHARAERIPATLREIGRLREISFREVGEGTGRAVDLDRFDDSYVHLFVWDETARRIVGAYRLGLTDEILPRLGKAGLYTSTLFRFKSRLLRQIDPAIELGRSFIHPDYQRAYQPLMLLWKGIGRFVAEHPRYRMLFGPVSISRDYSSMSKQLLVEFLRQNRWLGRLAPLVRAKNPPRFAPIRDWAPADTGTVVRDLGEVDEMIRQLEDDHRSVPVLLRQYLKLNAMLLGFNVDPDFGGVIDGLVLVDLLEVDRRILDKYMGREHAERFCAHHATAPADAALATV